MCALKMGNFSLHCARLGLFFFAHQSVKDDRLKVGFTAELSNVGRKRVGDLLMVLLVPLCPQCSLRGGVMGGRVEPVFLVGASDRGTACLAQEGRRQILLRRAASWPTISRQP